MITITSQQVQNAPDPVKESRLLAPIVGHVGDGNFYMLLLIDPSCWLPVDLMHGCTEPPETSPRNSSKNHETETNH